VEGHQEQQNFLIMLGFEIWILQMFSMGVISTEHNNRTLRNRRKNI